MAEWAIEPREMSKYFLFMSAKMQNYLIDLLQVVSHDLETIVANKAISFNFENSLLFFLLFMIFADRMIRTIIVTANEPIFNRFDGQFNIDKSAAHILPKSESEGNI